MKLGERAFEIVLARKVKAGEVKTAWFKRHRSTPITEVPTRWPQWYRELVESLADRMVELHVIGDAAGAVTEGQMFEALGAVPNLGKVTVRNSGAMSKRVAKKLGEGCEMLVECSLEHCRLSNNALARRGPAK